MLSLAKCYTYCGKIYWGEEPKEIEDTFDNKLYRILFVDLKEETTRQKEKVVRTRQNITDNTNKEW